MGTQKMKTGDGGGRMRADGMRKALLAVLAVAFATLGGCDMLFGGDYAERAREVAKAIGADDLVVHDTVSNFAQDSGRTVRFALRGDEIAMVPLPLTAPDRCRGGPCAQVLAENLRYARVQSGFAHLLVKAFAACGLRAVSDLQLMNGPRPGASEMPDEAFVGGFVWLDLPLRGDAARELDRVRACAEDFAGDLASARPPSPWRAARAELQVNLADLSAMPEPDRPLILGWPEALLSTSEADARYVTQSFTVEDGEARLAPPRLVLEGDASVELATTLAAAANAWLGANHPGLKVTEGSVSGPFQRMVGTDSNRYRFLLTSVLGPGGERLDVGVAVTHDFATGQSGDFALIEDVRTPQGLRTDLVERL